MEIVIIRPPLVYGTNAPGNFARLLRLIGSGLPLPFGNLHNPRSLVALENLVSLIALCIDHPNANNQLFLVSDGEDLSTTALIRRIAKALDKSVTLLPVPNRVLLVLASLFGKQTEVRQLSSSLRIDVSKAQQSLGWTPPLTVDEGLRLAVQGSRRAT